MNCKLLNTYKELVVKYEMLLREQNELWVVYVKKFGVLLEEKFNIVKEYIKLKKTISYCNMQKVRNKQIIQSHLNEYLEEELYNVKKDLHLIKMINESKTKPISKHEILQIKSMYRKIAQMIHPDLHPDFDMDERIMELWEQSKEAYFTKNLEKLEQLWILISKRLDDMQVIKTEKLEIPNLEQKIQNLELKMKEIVKTEPYTYKYLLEDDDLVKEEKIEIQKEIDEYKSFLPELKKKIEEFDIIEVIS